jgi:hypothetical protein
MRKLARLVVAIALVLPAVAHAKDLCVEQGNQRLLFKKVKALKKPGAVVPLHGIYSDGGLIGSIEGTAWVRSDGQVVVGVTVHGDYTSPPALGYDISIMMIVGSDLGGTGYYRTSTGGFTSDAWTPIDCREVVLP